LACLQRRLHRDRSGVFADKIPHSGGKRETTIWRLGSNQASVRFDRHFATYPRVARDKAALFAMISSVEQPHVKLSGDYEGPYVVEEARSDGRLLVAPDTSAQAIMDRLGHEPATLVEFEAAYGAVKPPDGER
jgi:hypothetical protein